MDFAPLYPSYQIVIVGWVERSEIHQGSDLMRCLKMQRNSVETTQHYAY